MSTFINNKGEEERDHLRVYLTTFIQGVTSKGVKVQGKTIDLSLTGLRFLSEIFLGAEDTISAGLQFPNGRYYEVEGKILARTGESPFEYRMTFSNETIEKLKQTVANV